MTTPGGNQPYARVIQDSICAVAQNRVITLEVRFHRWVLAEFNTHRKFSRNSESSRAVNFLLRLGMVERDPVEPLAWTSEQRGMSGGAELVGQEALDAFHLWDETSRALVRLLRKYVNKHPEPETRLHKSRLNRLLEPYLMHTVVVTAVDYEGFFDQRCHPAAEPEIRAAAEMMRDAIEASTPQVLLPGEWHLPYVEKADEDIATERLSHLDFPATLVKISAARCAGTSYLTQAKAVEEEDPEARYQLILSDLERYTRLATARPGHWSPMEHPCTPWPENDVEVTRTFKNFEGVLQTVTRRISLFGNLRGYRQLRLEVEA